MAIYSQHRNWIFGLLIFVGAFAYSTTGQAQTTDNLPITADQLHFEFGAQDGDFTIPCTHTLENELTQDWDVKCDDRHYTVHLWLKAFLRPVPPRLIYEILFWLTDHQIPVNQPGHFVGSTIRLSLSDVSPLNEVFLAQDLENTNVLRLKINHLTSTELGRRAL